MTDVLRPSSLEGSGNVPSLDGLAQLRGRVLVIVLAAMLLIGRLS